MSAGQAGPARPVLLVVVLECSFWLPLAACTYLALVPRLPELPPFQLSDVILHAVAFSYLTFALVLARFTDREALTRLSRMAFLAMAGYGLALELAQSLVPERTASLKDLLVDLVGIGIGLALARVAAPRLIPLALRVSGGR